MDQRKEKYIEAEQDSAERTGKEGEVRKIVNEHDKVSAGKQESRRTS